MYKNYMKLRMQYPKGHQMNLIAKLLMNSLYGKFGFKAARNVIEIIDEASKEDMIRFRFRLKIMCILLERLFKMWFN